METNDWPFQVASKTTQMQAEVLQGETMAFALMEEVELNRAQLDFQHKISDVIELQNGG